MEKSLIIHKIKNASRANGKPVGIALFEKMTGIKRSSWYGVYWKKWSEALNEAGLESNSLTKKVDEESLIKILADLTIKHGKFPCYADLRLERNNNKLMPCPETFTRIGDKITRIKKVLDFAGKHVGYELIKPILEKEYINTKEIRKETAPKEKYGFVYLGEMSIGRETRYKIGRTNLVSRRVNEITLLLPEDLSLIHAIKTDDMCGIEAYWHNRFKEKNTKGEWFKLEKEDIKVFKARKFM